MLAAPPLFGCVFSCLAAAALSAQVQVRILPNERVPESVVLENSSLRVGVSVGRAVRFTSFLDKASGIEFVDPERPAPVVNVNHSWHLLQGGFSIWQVRPIAEDASRGVEIELSSNYLENPYHLYLRLSLSDRPELELDYRVENKAVKGVHDMTYVARGGLTAGLTFLHYMKPKNAGERRVIFRRGQLHFNDDPEGIGMYFLRTQGAPVLPLVVSYPNLKAGLLLDREASDFDWSFESAEAALAFQRAATATPGNSLQIFKGILMPFRGGWQTVFRWWKERVRSGLDLSNYQRTGHRQYRKKVVGNFTMTFDHDFYDPVNNRFRIEEFLARGRREFGGYDYFIFWHNYPRLGIDNRNQWDMYDSLPGGLEGVRKVVDQARAQGVWTMLSFNPWDVIGNPRDMAAEQARIMARTGAQVTYLDILREAGESFRRQFDQVNPDIVFSSENRPSLKGLELSTGSQLAGPHVNQMPRLDLLRFVVPEHNIQNTDRASRNREALIRNSLFNFTGVTVWESVFGEINRFTWQERNLITRYNLLAHDHVDAYVDDQPEPLIPTREFLPRLANSPAEGARLAPAVLDEDYTRRRRPPVRIYVNKFHGREKIVYSLWNGEREKTDRYHDNRIIGKLFLVDIPEDWRLVNIWDGLPAEVEADETGRWAWVASELPDASCVFAAMPKRISVSRQGQEWLATTRPGEHGELRLVGMDVSYRPQYGPSANASSGLRFRAGQVEPNVEGYVMVQLLEQGMVRDVVAVRIDR